MTLLRNQGKTASVEIGLWIRDYIKNNKLGEEEQMKVVSFFSGLGGLDKGFVDTGYDIIWANDFDRYAVQTYKANFGEHIVLGDISNPSDCNILEIPV